MKPKAAEAHSWAGYAGNDVLLEERSQGEFSVIVLGQKELKKRDPKTVINQFAWVNEEDLEFINADFETNLNFIDWYQERKEDFCPDCGAWFPKQGGVDPETGEECVCPRKKCLGRLYDSGICPYCETPAPEDGDICPKCEFNWQTQS